MNKHTKEIVDEFRAKCNTLIIDGGWNDYPDPPDFVAMTDFFEKTLQSQHKATIEKIEGMKIDASNTSGNVLYDSSRNQILDLVIKYLNKENHD